MRQWRRWACVLGALTLLAGAGVAAGQTQLAPRPEPRGASSSAAPARRERPAFDERAVARVGTEHRTHSSRTPDVALAGGGSRATLRLSSSVPTSESLRPRSAVVRAIGARGPPSVS